MGEKNAVVYGGPKRSEVTQPAEPVTAHNAPAVVKAASPKASGRSKLTREPKQIDAQLGKQTGAELSALFVRRGLVPPSGLCRPDWISRMTKPAEDRFAGEFNPAGRLTGPCDSFFN